MGPRRPHPFFFGSQTWMLTYPDIQPSGFQEYKGITSYFVRSGVAFLRRKPQYEPRLRSPVWARGIVSLLDADLCPRIDPIFVLLVRTTPVTKITLHPLQIAAGLRFLLLLENSILAPIRLVVQVLPQISTFRRRAIHICCALTT